MLSNYLLQPKKSSTPKKALDKVALDALLEMINDEDYATHQHHSDPDFTTQNGKMMGKSTEVEDGLSVSIPGSMLGSISGGTINDLTNQVVPGVPEEPLVSESSFFKEGDDNSKRRLLTLRRRLINQIGMEPRAGSPKKDELQSKLRAIELKLKESKTADTKSYGAGTPIGGTPTTQPQTQSQPAVPGQPTPTTQPQQQPVAAPAPTTVPPVNSINKTPNQLSQDAQNQSAQTSQVQQLQNDTGLNQGQLTDLINTIKSSSITPEQAARMVAAIGVKPTPTMLPPRDDMRSHLDEDVKNEVKEGIHEPAPSTQQPTQPQEQWQAPNQDELLRRALASTSAYSITEILKTLGLSQDEWSALSEGQKERLTNTAIKALRRKKKAVQTEDNVNEVCPGCKGQNFKSFDSNSEDGSLVECNDCGCLFAV